MYQYAPSFLHQVGDQNPLWIVAAPRHLIPQSKCNKHLISSMFGCQKLWDSIWIITKFNEKISTLLIGG